MKKNIFLMMPVFAPLSRNLSFIEQPYDGFALTGTTTTYFNLYTGTFSI